MHLRPSCKSHALLEFIFLCSTTNFIKHHHGRNVGLKDTERSGPISRSTSPRQFQSPPGGKNHPTAPPPVQHCGHRQEDTDSHEQSNESQQPDHRVHITAPHGHAGDVSVGGLTWSPRCRRCTAGWGPGPPPRSGSTRTWRPADGPPLLRNPGPSEPGPKTRAASSSSAETRSFTSGKQARIVSQRRLSGLRTEIKRTAGFPSVGRTFLG